ncbi:adenosine deaminase [Marinilactibacillus sp. Marseille-P9653]|uniref:adenosine deaminase n=1 Tax=Marinilactibacillus sp. Marseille-P9653 TaxID=2866583 RepID=UPI001CE44D3B|nr:adenosine deaminase [Marinilactibacillus sp. Marseille-P9653]
MNRTLIHKLPKVELHCHLDGSVPINLLKEMALEQGMDEKIMDNVRAPEDCEDLKDYLSCFDVILSVLQTEENLKRAVYAVIEEAHKENVRYLEIRFAPLLHLAKKMTPKQAITAVSEGVAKAQEDFPIHVNILICGLRKDSEEENTQLFEAVYELKAAHVVGVDIAGDEAQYPNEYVEKSIGYAGENHFQITMHSGECGCARNVLTAMHLGATRIGHGVAIQNDLEVLKEVRDRNVLLEMCPTSNVQTRAVKSWADYPLRFFLDQGIPVSINTDNRTVSNTTLTDEFMLCVKHCQLTHQEMKKITLNSVEHSFASLDLKKKLIEQVESQYN